MSGTELAGRRTRAGLAVIGRRHGVQMETARLETARLIPLTIPARPQPADSAPDGGAPVEASPDRAARVDVSGDRVTVDRLSLIDAAAAAFLDERSGDDRVGIAERALRIGMSALQDVGQRATVDLMRREFESLLGQMAASNEQAAGALDRTLRENFADQDGRLPRTLERFLGDRGALRSFVGELFDETRRDSAIGRIQTLLGRYFDGDASRLALLLDPTRMGSPLNQFRDEVTRGFAALNERLGAIEAAAAARGAERARSAAKGGDFEDLLAEMLGRIARGAGDLLDRTSDESGDVLRSKKGDFLLTIDPRLTNGADLRVVIEAKDRAISARAIRHELREARENRGAAIAVAVFAPDHAPSGVEPFALLAGDIYCVIDPEAPEPAHLEAAIGLARLLALAGLREREAELDIAAISAALGEIREQMEAIRGMKAQLTSIGTATKALWEGLDRLKQAVLARVAEAESELKPKVGEASAGP